MTQQATPLTAFPPSQIKRLRRIAREAHNTWVGRNWPSMADMRRDGIGAGLVEKREKDPAIRRYLDTFQPEFVLELLATLDAARAAPVIDVERLKLAMSRHEDIRTEQGQGHDLAFIYIHDCDFGCAADIAEQYALISSKATE